MERREFLLALGGGAAAVIASAEPAAAEGGMHPPKFPALQAAAAHCVTTSSDCMRHCIGMLAMKDYSMTGCVNTAYQVGVACNALQALAAVNSPSVPAFAKAVAEVVDACRKECEKHLDTPECKACAEACKATAEECRKVTA